MSTPVSHSPSGLGRTHGNGPGFDVPGYQKPIRLKDLFSPGKPQETPLPKDEVQLSPEAWGGANLAQDISRGTDGLIQITKARALSHRLRSSRRRP